MLPLAHRQGVRSRPMTRPTRRLAAIMFTDIVGYTALMAESEERGLRVRKQHREVLQPMVERYRGESIEARGDESLSTFPTALDAVNCALAFLASARAEARVRARRCNRIAG